MSFRQVYSLNEIDTIVEKIIKEAESIPVWIFEGEMGAGKTTLIKKIGEKLGIKDTIQSPSYGLIHEYQSENSTVFHFDLFRLKNLQEALDIGIEEYLYSGNHCFIEWADVIYALLPATVYEIKLVVKDEKREILAEQKTMF